MARSDRRDKVALDQAYSYYKNAVAEETSNIDLRSLVNSLKTVSFALRGSQVHNFKLTTRLWLRIEQALFDKLLTTFAGYLVVLRADGSALEAPSDLPADGTIQFHPEGLKRMDDVIRMPIQDISQFTLMKLNKVWKERGPFTRHEGLHPVDCTTGICPIKPFVVGHDQLVREAQNGKQAAYYQWWDLYWQDYCCGDKEEKLLIARQMATLESIWGNLYY